MQAFNPIFRIVYNGKNITEDISSSLIEISYTDKITGESDELTITIEDKDKKWSNGWYPEKGASIQITIGDDSNQKISPPFLTIDQIEISWTKDGTVVSIQCLGAGINKSSRTKSSYAHENKTLSEIINTIAAKYGYTVVGTIANIAIGRVTKKREGDLAFVQRLANEYGYIFSIKGQKMIFTEIKSLDNVRHVTSLDISDCSSVNVTDKSIGIYKAANVRSHNPNTAKTVKASYTVQQQANADQIYFPQLLEGATEEIRTKAENEQQASAKAEATLYRKNSLQQTARVITRGNCLLVAGNNIELTGLGKLSGIWNILQAVHSISRSGYTVDLELKRIVPASVSGSRKLPKVPVKKKEYSVKQYKNKDNISFPELAE